MSPINTNLPEILRPFFWDYDFDSLDWENHRDFIIRRILKDGSWQAITWLRQQVGDESVRKWLMAHNGGRLSPRQLRFWQVLLDLPVRSVNRWVSAAEASVWGKRLSP